MTELNPEPEKTESAARPKRSRRWFFFRLVFRVIFALVLFIVGLTALIAFQPISWSRADQLLRDAIRQTTGTEFHFKQASWRLNNGTVQIDNPRLLDPENSEVLIALSRIDIDINMSSVFRSLLPASPPILLENITAVGPLEIVFEEKEGRLSPDPKHSRLLDQIRSTLAELEPTNGTPLQVETLEIERVELQLRDLSGEVPENKVRIRDARLWMQFRPDFSPEGIFVGGELAGQKQDASITMRFTPKVGMEEMAFQASIGSVDSRDHTSYVLPFDFYSEGVEMNGAIRTKAEGVWSVHCSTTAPRVGLVGAGAHGVDHNLEDITLDTEIEWNNSGRLLEFRRLAMTTANSALESSGTLALTEPYAYSLSIEKMELRNQLVALLERTLFDEQRITTPDQGRFRITGSIGGEATKVMPENILAHFEVGDLNLEIPNTPEPIRSVTLKGTVSNEFVELDSGFAYVQGVPLQISGKVEGRPLEGEVQHALFDWQIAGEMQGLSDLIAEGAPENDWGVSFSGGVTGAGRIEVEDVAFDRLTEIFEQAEVSGRLVFDRAEIRSSKMSEPVREVSGILDVSRGTASVTNLSGRLGDAKIELSGSVKGNRRFWIEPVADLNLQSSIRIDSIADYFSWFDLEPPELPPVGGKASITAAIQGPLEHLKQTQISGTARVEDFFMDLTSDGLGGTLELPVCEVLVSPDHLTIKQASGSWGDLALQIGGEFDADAGVLDIQLAGKLDGAKVLLPRALSKLDGLGGEVTASHEFQFGRVGEEPAGAQKLTLAGLGADWLDKYSHDALDMSQELSIDVAGQLTMNQAQLMYVGMPESALLTDVYGTIHYDRSKLWTEPGSAVSLRPGVGADLAEVTTRITLPTERERRLELLFEINGTSVDLDNWISGWQPPKPPPGSDPNRKPLPTYIEVQIQSKQVKYLGLEGTDLIGEVVYEFAGPGDQMLRWSDARAQTKNGNIEVSGFRGRRAGDYVAGHRIHAEDLELARVIGAFYDSAMDSGVSAGLVSGDIVMEREGPKDAAYQGQGSFSVTDSRLTSNAILRGLGSLLGLGDFFEDVTFTDVSAEVEIRDHIVWIAKDSPIVFENPSILHPLSMVASGKVGPESKLDMGLDLHFLPVLDRIPIVGTIWATVTGNIFQFRVRGTLDDPLITPTVPLVDLRDLPLRRTEKSSSD